MSEHKEDEKQEDIPWVFPSSDSRLEKLLYSTKIGVEPLRHGNLEIELRRRRQQLYEEKYSY